MLFVSDLCKHGQCGVKCGLSGGLGSVADLVTPTRGSSSSGSGGRNNIISDNRYSVTMSAGEDSIVQ